jgi:osmotically-inducible protein OsmY
MKPHARAHTYALTPYALKPQRALICALLLAGAVPGCAAYRQCGFHGCPGDAEISAKVQALFDQYPSLEAPNEIHVQTVNRVVYLSGLVGTPFQRRMAESVALAAGGVTRVINTIGVSNER